MEKFPEVVYVRFEDDSDEPFMVAEEDLDDHASVGETVNVAVYRLEKTAKLSTKTELVGEESVPGKVPTTAKRGKKAKPEPVIAPGTVDGPSDARKETATKEDAQAALEKVFSAKGLQSARDLLYRFGVQRLQDMNPGQYPTFVQHVEHVMAGGEV